MRAIKMLIKQTPIEVAEGFWMLGTSEYPVFLFRDGDEGAIFEGGVGADAAVVAEQLAQLGISTDIVKQVFITHAHPDHVMAIPAFRDMFPNLRVCASQAAAKTLSIEKAIGFFGKIDGLLTESLINAGSVQDKHRPEPMTEKQIAVDEILADGDTITVGSVNINVITTPGHDDVSRAC